MAISFYNEFMNLNAVVNQILERKSFYRKISERKISHFIHKMNNNKTFLSTKEVEKIYIAKETNQIGFNY